MKAKLKILTVFIGCFLFRLLPFRVPNLEPIMASIMPIGRKYGKGMAFFFGFLSMVLYDVVTGYVGLWTWTTSITYGILGICSVYYFERFKPKVINFAIFAFVATIFFDLVTGILFAPFFGVSMTEAFFLQIPFTLIHLAGNIGFALTLSPILNKWLFSYKLFPREASHSGLVRTLGKRVG